VTSIPASDAAPPSPAPREARLSLTNRAALGPLVALFLTLAVASAIRLRLLSMPLERDEGEYAYAGQLILQGHHPYERLYNMKWPGTYYCYALIEGLFGQTIPGVRLGVLGINLAAIVLVFLISRRLFDACSAAAAAAAYALLSVSPGTLGFAGHATHFVVLFALASILFLQRAIERRRLGLYFLAGVFAGLAPLMKQPGVVFTAFVVACWAWHEMGRAPRVMSRGVALVAGIVLPFAILFGVLCATHTLRSFLLWTIDYARHYGEPLNGAVFSRFLESFRIARGGGFLFWIVAAIGLMALPFGVRTREAAFFLVWFVFFSFLGVLPGLVFRPHYFILMLPAIALLVGAAVCAARERLGPRHPRWATAVMLGLVLIPLSTAFAIEGAFYFWLTPEQACRRVYRKNPFVEAVAVADYIRARTGPDDSVAVLGSEPEIYFYCRRPAATGFIYMYSLLEKQPYAEQFRRQMIREVEAAHPKYVVFVNLDASWLPPPGADMSVVQWFLDYQRRQLKPVGLVEVDDAYQVTYRWDHLDMSPPDNVQTLMTVYERLSAP
jgi:Dolichyl-phosphate-mannose-protein mannosyltransferase